MKTICAVAILVSWLAMPHARCLAQSTDSADQATQAAPAQTQQLPNPATQLQIFAYPNEGQSADVQAQDSNSCLEWAQAQTANLPAPPATQPPGNGISENALQMATQAAGMAGAPGKAGGAGTANQWAGMAAGAAGGKGSGWSSQLGNIGGLAGTAKGGAGGAEAAALGAAASAATARHGAGNQKTQSQPNEALKRAYSACMESRGYTVK
jgi:hypothetical protein